MLDEANSIARVIASQNGKPINLDFSHFKESIEHDMGRRDFTINAMAVDLYAFLSGDCIIIDPFDGQSDLRNKIVRVVTNSVFKEDAARMLRAVRLAAELRFEIESGTEQSIKQDAQIISLVAGEKKREELLKMLTLPNASCLLRYLDRLKLLIAIIPELEQMRNVEQPKEHYWDVLNHSFETVATVEFLLHEIHWEYGNDDLLRLAPWSDELKGHFEEKISSGSNRRIILKLGGLLHDLAKPETKKIDETGRMRFIGHDKLGAQKSVEILGKLRFSKQEIKLVKNLVLYHLRPVQMANVGMPTNRAIYRYFRDMGEDGIDIFFLALADYLAAKGPNLDAKEWLQHSQLINYMLNENLKQRTKLSPIVLVNGNDLINIFHLTSGPLIGKLLRLVHEAQAAGEINTRDEAINLVRKELGNK